MRKAWEDLPGAQQVATGLRDLGENRWSIAALLVWVASPRLRGLGVHVPQPTRAPADAEAALYLALEAEDEASAHARFNALRREIVSFAEALEGRLWS